MKKSQNSVQAYLTYCEKSKRLDEKTVRAYRTDLRQFVKVTGSECQAGAVSVKIIEDYIAGLNSTYKPKTVKRKIASVKAFFHYLEYRGAVKQNPFHTLHMKLREPLILPRTIPLKDVESLLRTVYSYHNNAITVYQKRKSLCDLAVIELLFATGIRISELCALTPDAVDLREGVLLIYGKGDKERRIQIGNRDVLKRIKEYATEFYEEIEQSGCFFSNTSGKRVSDQSVRRMLKKYAEFAGLTQHITPHMLRHTFATSLLEADVDIRYIQKMLGHSSISVTEIYTHVAMAKQKSILTSKHPRNKFSL